MTKKFKNLNEAFDVEPEIIEEESESITVIHDPVETKKKEKQRLQEIETDYNYTRKNLYSIIEKGQDALASALEAAQETDEARKYEVVSQLIKSVSDASDKLMQLQKNLATLTGEKMDRGPTTVNNSVFLGSTTELAKFIKASMMPKVEEDK